MSRAEITTPEVIADESVVELSLRPQRLAEFIGQSKVKDSLDIAIRAAMQRKESLDHALFHGPPGLGKTTLAEPMEDYKIDIRLSDGPNAQTVTMAIEKFTLVGATTRYGLLSSPLRARFGLTVRLDFYPAGEIETIVRRTAEVLGVELHADGAREIASRSRGTPRIANRLLRRVRDFAQVRANGVISRDVAREALLLLDVDEFGLDDMDTRLLRTIIEKFDGGPVGVQTLAAAIGEDADTIEEVYEPFLVQNGLLQRTARGRVASPQAYRHLGFTPPVRAQADLF
jgi:Holliday junction DNA helicase RuvB